MKISCDMARDLIPLYNDGALSRDSREAVATHLASCEACRAYNRAIKRQLAEEKRASVNSARIPSPRMDYTEISRRIKRKSLQCAALSAMTGFALGRILYKKSNER